MLLSIDELNFIVKNTLDSENSSDPITFFEVDSLHEHSIDGINEFFQNKKTLLKIKILPDCEFYDMYDLKKVRLQFSIHTNQFKNAVINIKKIFNLNNKLTFLLDTIQKKVILNIDINYEHFPLIDTRNQTIDIVSETLSQLKLTPNNPYYHLGIEGDIPTISFPFLYQLGLENNQINPFQLVQISSNLYNVSSLIDAFLLSSFLDERQVIAHNYNQLLIKPFSSTTTKLMERCKNWHDELFQNEII